MQCLPPSVLLNVITVIVHRCDSVQLLSYFKTHILKSSEDIAFLSPPYYFPSDHNVQVFKPKGSLLYGCVNNL